MNITSYSRDINGIMVDLAGSHPDFTAADFTFRMGASNDPASWAAAPEPLELQVLAGQGIGGADRVVIIWPDGAIKNTYLLVIVAANENTGIAEPDTFFFGNRIGDTFAGTPPGAFMTSAADEVATRNNAQPYAHIGNPYDFDANGVVSAEDQVIARNNGGFLPRIQISSPVPVTPLIATAASQASRPRTEHPTAESRKNAIVSGLTVAGHGSKSAPQPLSAQADEQPAVAERKVTLNVQSPASRLADRAFAATWDEVDGLASSFSGEETLEDLLAELGAALGEMSIVRT